MSCLKIFLVLLLASNLAFGAPFFNRDRPQTKKPQTLSEVLQRVQNDTLQAVYSKAAVVQFIGETMANAAVEGSRVAGRTVAARTPNVPELEAAVNKTEEYIKKEKLAMIQRVFDLKRQIVRSLNGLNQSFNAQVNGLINGINAALNGTLNGITVTKTAVANIYGQMNWNNTIGGLNEAINNIVNKGNHLTNVTLDALNNATLAINQATNATLTNLVNSKLQLQQAAENFNSQELFHKGEAVISLGLNATIDGITYAGNKTGVFNALDDMVHAAAKLPTNINKLLSAQKETQETVDPKEVQEGVSKETQIGAKENKKPVEEKAEAQDLKAETVNEEKLSSSG